MNLIAPVKAPITADFGIWPDDPVAQAAYRALGLKGHNGIDYGVRFGTPCVAACDATVRAFDGPHTVYLTFNWNGVLHDMCYAHGSLLPLKLGQRVKQGEVIFYSGTEGGKFAPHLHFGIRPVNHPPGNDGYYWFVDPKPFFGGSKMFSPEEVVRATAKALQHQDPYSDEAVKHWADSLRNGFPLDQMIAQFANDSEIYLSQYKALWNYYDAQGRADAGDIAQAHVNAGTSYQTVIHADMPLYVEAANHPGGMTPEQRQHIENAQSELDQALA